MRIGDVATLALLVTLGTVRIGAGQEARTDAIRAAGPERPADADQPARSRQGMWLSAGLGAGSASLHCRICAGEQSTRGTTGYLRVGTTVNTRLLVGAELNGWMRSDQEGSQRVLALTGNGYWYPSPRHAYYVKAGFGLSNYRQWTEEGGEETALTAGAFTGHVGVGYEVRVNPRMSVVPYFNLLGSAKGALAAESDDGTRFERNRLSTRANVLLLQLGLGVTWH